jgi:carbon monoxide dehydrogenase subunit G
MKLEQSFEIKAPLEEVWAALIDIERVAPCLPGAEVTGREDDGSYQGTFQVKLGPTTAAYRGTLRMVDVDEEGHVATLSANAQERRGGGSAKATMVSTMSEAGEATRVDVQTDFTLTGRLARFGRGGMIQDVSNRLLKDFSECLQRTLAPEEALAAPPGTAAAPLLAPAPGTAGPDGGRAGAGAPGEPGGVEVATSAPPGERAPAAAPAEGAAEIAALRAEVAALRRDVELLKARVAAAPAKARPINAVSLLLSVLKERLRRLFRRSG